MKELVKKPLNSINTGDVKLTNDDYQIINVDIFDKELFDKHQKSTGIRCFGDSSFKGGSYYMSYKPDDTYQYSFIQDDDARIIYRAYIEFIDENESLFKELLEYKGKPLYYVSDKDLNVKLNYGDVVMRRNMKYINSGIELLELQTGTYGHTIEGTLTQEEQFYEWLTSAPDKKHEVTFRGKNIIVAPSFSQYQNSNDSLLITDIAATEYELYIVNINMEKLSKKISVINNKLYKIIRQVFDQYYTIKKETIIRDWNGNELKP